MPRYAQLSSSYNGWSILTQAAYFGFEPYNAMAFTNAYSDLVQVDLSNPAGDNYFNFRATTPTTDTIPPNATITRYRFFWRQHGNYSPSGGDPACADAFDEITLWTYFSNKWQFLFSPYSYNITRDAVGGDYFYNGPIPDEINFTPCRTDAYNCMIDSYVFDPLLNKFSDPDPTKSLYSPAFWNIPTNLSASFALPTDQYGFFSTTNFIGGPSDTYNQVVGYCCPAPGNGNTYNFAFLVDYTVPTSNTYRKRYNVSFLNQLSDATSAATTTTSTASSTSSSTTTNTCATTTSTTTTSTIPSSTETSITIEISESTIGIDISTVTTVITTASTSTTTTEQVASTATTTTTGGGTTATTSLQSTTNATTAPP